uniref:Uncharacterized protein n=1 Tax=Rhizophora mucronata TaxID=61149 RepID=A0A2P2Q2L7_RHIMU
MGLESYDIPVTVSHRAVVQ